MTNHSRTPAIDAHLEQLQRSMHELIEATEEFIEGAGRAVELDLEYCEALSVLEEAVAESRKTVGGGGVSHG